MLNRSERLLLGAGGGLLLLAGWVLITHIPRGETPAVQADTRIDALIERLDAYVQRRFATVEGAFGMNRLTTGPHDFWSIQAESESQAIAAEFERHGAAAYFRTVSLKRGSYTWGTPVRPMYSARTRLGAEVRFRDREQLLTGLANSPGTYCDVREVGEGKYHHSLSWPIRVATIGGSSEERDGPELPDLQAGIQESITRLRTAPSHTFRTGNWDVVARSIKAGTTKCLSCHQDAKGRPARLNDTLGLALYVVERLESGQQVAGSFMAQ